MLAEPDSFNTAGAQKGTAFACSPGLYPFLERQLAHLQCDGTHSHTAVLQPRKADGSWHSRSTAAYPAELNRRTGITMG
eukprot:scaffold33414_cov146-Isochrysis_galbana.AAC.1